MSINDYLDHEYPPDTIYHYTTQDSLVKILQSKSLWASKISCLNDSLEYKLAFNIAADLLRMNFNPKDQIIDSLIKTTEFISNYNVFVCSFSEKNDLLSQWRAYGNRTNSVSIGFNSSFLLEAADNQHFSLEKCVYDSDKQYKIINHFLNEYIPRISSTKPDVIDTDPGVIHGSSYRFEFLVSLMRVAPIFKDEGFTEEAEWRLISDIAPQKEQLSFRSGVSFLIPYYEFNLGDVNNTIRNVTIGPSPNREIAKTSLSMLFTKHSYSFQDEIFITNIPYRNW